ncbi:MAG: siderophore-interacting protein, partial [Akkermansiaceae bacterium]|nr:siderophore-interacting protein [Akkermansiaceae bacterium]
AIPAISQLMEEIDDAVPLRVIIEIAHPDARVELPDRSGVEIAWVERDVGDLPGDALVEAVTG